MFGFFRKKQIISRIEFERCIEATFEHSRAGSYGAVKSAIGGAWEVAIDSLYQANASKINSDSDVAIFNQCCVEILQALKQVGPDAGAEFPDAGYLGEVAGAKEVQQRLTQEFAKVGVDFMTLHPTIHQTLLREGVLFGRIERSVEMFTELAELAQQKGRDDRERAAILLHAFEVRLKLLKP